MSFRTPFRTTSRVSVRTARIAAAVLAAGAALTAGALPASASPHPGPAAPFQRTVAISDVHPDARHGRHATGQDVNDEWVRLTNRSRHTVSLRGYTLNERNHRYVLQLGYVRLMPGRSVTVHTGRGHDDRDDLYLNRRFSVWDDRADTATLRDDRGRTVDTRSWGPRDHRGRR